MVAYQMLKRRGLSRDGVGERADTGRVWGSFGGAADSAKVRGSR